jgi:hypothetical protein
LAKPKETREAEKDDSYYGPIYEYKVFEFEENWPSSREHWLNICGQKGWELVAVLGDKAYMKRRLGTSPSFPG